MVWAVVATFVILWLFGWISAISESSVGQEKWGLKKIGGIVLLFFIWPYIAWCIATQGDI